MMENYLENAMVYYTDFAPLNLSRGHYFKRGWDHCLNHSLEVQKLRDSHDDLTTKLKLATEALEQWQDCPLYKECSTCREVTEKAMATIKGEK